MWLCIFATPAMRLAPPIVQLRHAHSLSAGPGLAAGRAAPMMAVEQHGHSAAFQCHTAWAAPRICEARLRHSAASPRPSVRGQRRMSLPMATQVETVKFTGNAVDTGVATVMDGNAMEDMWDKSRGRPLRRSLALWLFSMKATWKLIRAHKNEAKQIKAAAWVRQH